MLGNRFKIFKNPDENPDLQTRPKFLKFIGMPMNFKNFGREPKVSRLLSNLVIAKRKSKISGKKTIG